MTNRDKLNQESNEELAELLSYVSCAHCKAYDFCHCDEFDDYECLGIIEKWLEARIEE